VVEIFDGVGDREGGLGLEEKAEGTAFEVQIGSENRGFSAIFELGCEVAGERSGADSAFDPEETDHLGKVEGDGPGAGGAAATGYGIPDGADEQLTGEARFDEKILSTLRDGFDADRVTLDASEYDYRNRRAVGVNRLEGGQPLAIGEIEIEQDQVGTLWLGEKFESFEYRSSLQDVEGDTVQFHQHFFNQFGIARVVFDQ